MAPIYKICTRTLWHAAKDSGRFEGAPIDQADGYIHFSTADQVAETARRHFSGETDLVLITVQADDLGEALRFEASRGGALFPHLYAPLRFDQVVSVEEFPLGEDGLHVLPARLRGAET